MATKPLKGIIFPGLEDTYIIPEVDDSLSVSGASADAKKTGDMIQQKTQVQIITWEDDD